MPRFKNKRILLGKLYLKIYKTNNVQKIEKKNKNQDSDFEHMIVTFKKKYNTI